MPDYSDVREGLAKKSALVQGFLKVIEFEGHPQTRRNKVCDFKVENEEEDSYVDLSGLHLDGYGLDLQNLDLGGFIFSDSNLGNSNVSGTDLGGSVWYAADLSFVKGLDEVKSYEGMEVSYDTKIPRDDAPDWLRLPIEYLKAQKNEATIDITSELVEKLRAKPGTDAKQASAEEVLGQIKDLVNNR